MVSLARIASGKGNTRLLIGGYHSRMLLKLYEAPPMYVRFNGTRVLARRVCRFMESSDCIEFASTWMLLLQQSTTSEIGITITRKAAIAAIACLDRGLQEAVAQSED
jgi:hypothetical protein